MGQPNSVKPAQSAACPRCGYHQRGVIESWTDRCPLSGLCSECGLELDWSRVFQIARHPWLFEYHWRDGPIRRLLMTIMRALTPRRFWREVALDDPIHLRPVAVIAIVLLLLFLLSYVLIAATEVHTAMRPFRGCFSTTSQYWQTVFEIVYHVWIMLLPIALMAPVVVLIVMPLTFLMIPATLRRSRVRPGHVCRIALYGLVMPCVVAIVSVLVQFALHAVNLEGIASWINPRLWFESVTYRNLIYTAIAAALAVLLALWLSYWWTIAAGMYLRLPTPKRIAAVMALVSLLAGVTLHLWIVLQL